MRVDLLGAIAELYQLAPSDFTVTRNARARQATVAGDKSLASEIRRLPKPTASASALNRLAHENPEATKEFNSLGSQLRAAQQQADRERLDTLLQGRKTLLRQTSAEVQRTAAANHIRLTASSVNEIEQSLQAALADPAALAAVFSSRLIRPIQSDGIEPADLDQAVAGPPIRHRQTSRPLPGPTGPGRTAASKAASRMARLERAQKAAADADTKLQAIRSRQLEIDAERENLDAEARALQEQFDDLERRRASLESRGEAMDRDLRRAADSARAAHDAVDSASKSG